jgi:cbb3-type cytochrome oxidase subunit 3
MSLTDIMSGAGLSHYAEVGLVLFMFAFVVIILWTFRPSKKASYDKAAQMPLDDEHPQTPRKRGD